MATIKDVAIRAGVSISTVSAVVNKNKHVSDGLTKRVYQAIEDLDYRPNQIARSLKQKTTKLIGVTVTEITNPFYPLMLKGVDDIALKNGYNIILCTTNDDSEREYKLLQSLIDQGVDGIMMATFDGSSSRNIELLKKHNTPHVLINRAPNGYLGYQATINSYKIGQLALKHLVQLGHEDIAFIGGKRLNSFQREEGFLHEANESGITLSHNRVIHTEYNVEAAYSAMNSLIAKGDVPSAIFAASDIMAFGIIKALLDSGYDVPKDVSVIGSDNINFS